jgi:hypothetical protein
MEKGTSCFSLEEKGIGSNLFPSSIREKATPLLFEEKTT